ncbi:HAMP domain-containing sensor histidine kinase [uncultured Sphaerochaeta sp.]|uniref:HAMP domain-containing sensor histidine kinase n=1 Tax=uncultured Sphaerochaeta sp. TaxID=886478 RepID=UPI002A0A97A1|nr:HAMP domain-containing sensor histidine kinase [uncultured Sphaerochaeta sp.]
MKLKNRFVLIIVGSFVIPALVSSLVFLFLAPDFLQLKLGPAGFRQVSVSLSRAKNLTELEAISEEFPQQMFFYVFDSQGLPVFQKESATGEGLFSTNISQHTVFSRELLLSDGNRYFVLSGINRELLSMPLSGGLVLGSVLLFLSILSMITIRSINTSLMQLKKGTKRIADGDLDTPIVIKGDDTFVSLAESFDTMRLKVKEEQDRQMRFFMGVSHDLKTPLASITGYSEALLDGLAPDRETEEKYLRIIYTKGNLLEQRISHLIGYMKLNTIQFRHALQQQKLVPFLQAFVETQSEEALLQGYQFKASLDVEENTLVRFDPELFSRAMENLLQNCVRYGIHTKPIRLSCEYFENQISLRFSNYHIKMLSPFVAEHMFEPFFRGDQSRRGEGFGLGLASVKSIVESHGWSVRGYSLENAGVTVFEILIPLGL